MLAWQCRPVEAALSIFGDHPSCCIDAATCPGPQQPIERSQYEIVARVSRTLDRAAERRPCTPDSNVGKILTASCLSRNRLFITRKTQCRSSLGAGATSDIMSMSAPGGYEGRLVKNEN